jgi:predicted house-cleaning NTP pyrophosphatase (Maf/HAM1 superfamily)
VVTRVRFRSLPEAELDAYLRAETPYDVAGSAKSKGSASRCSMQSIPTTRPRSSACR